MKNNNRGSIIAIAIFFVLGSMGPISAQAATSPSLGVADSFSVLAESTATSANMTTIFGDLGLSTGLEPARTGPWTVGGTEYFGPSSLAFDARADALIAFNDLAGQTSSGTWSLDPSPVPGVWTTAVSATFAGPTLTLNGDYDDVWVFQVGSDFTFTGEVILTGTAQACNVFWQIGNDATIAAGSTFVGTLIAGNDITMVSGATVSGRVLSLDGALTTDNNTITEPGCVPAPATLHIVKTVINDNGGTAVASDFTINVTGTNVSSSSFAGSETGVDITLDGGVYSVIEPITAGYSQSFSADCSGTILAGETLTCTITNDDIAPQLTVTKVVVNDSGRTKVISDFSLFVDGSSVVSGVATTTLIGLHTVSETADADYTTIITGDCAADGTITLALGDNAFCIITNNDIAAAVVIPPSGGSGGGSMIILPPVPPLIDVVKVPTPLALPGGPGSVLYTYTLRNIGTVPVTDITMVGDTCDPILLISGDTNADGKLDVNETWIHTCTTTLQQTHTNTVVATGWANGISAVDITSATVVVGLPIVPPLINVTKVPSAFTLPAQGGLVTYTVKITNPGTVAISNVSLTDDKCSPLEYISGDTNGDSKLDPTEIWTYTCTSNLTQTTTNIASAVGEANGLTVRDFAIVTVVVAAPGFPKAGLPPAQKDISWVLIILMSTLIVVSTSTIIMLKKR